MKDKKALQHLSMIAVTLEKLTLTMEILNKKLQMKALIVKVIMVLIMKPMKAINWNRQRFLSTTQEALFSLAHRSLLPSIITIRIKLLRKPRLS